MNNKGFTIIEVLVTLVIISLLTIITSKIINTSLAASREEAYELMKQNIVTASYNYINECNAKMIDCDFSYTTNNTFYAEKLEKYGYFKNLESPINGDYVGNCLLLKATFENGVTKVKIKDECY